MIIIVSDNQIRIINYLVATVPGGFGIMNNINNYRLERRKRKIEVEKEMKDKGEIDVSTTLVDSNSKLSVDIEGQNVEDIDLTGT